MNEIYIYCASVGLPLYLYVNVYDTNELYDTYNYNLWTTALIDQINVSFYNAALG